ncbi:AMP-binding protein [Streptomyces sp. NPDC048192]|uniref:AMP-binding protein n=1 Tax=Streptomyces sp. NPDC048192 TaxID=3365510 RepID=UPI00371D96DA
MPSQRRRRLRACLTLLPRFDAGKALGTLGEHGVTVFAGVPTVFSRLLRQPDRDAYDVSRLRVSLSGGAAMPVQVLHDFQAAFDCVVLEGYGMSETSPVASFNPLQAGPKPGSVGIPIRGVEMRVVDNGAEVPQGDTGEIAIRGHNVIKGYWQRGDRHRDPGRLVLHRGPRPGRPGRILLDRRTDE